MFKVSIIIPTYNQAKYIAQTIDSTLAQTYPNVEVIVVNDGSTDDTAAILVGYGDRIKCISQANRGLAGARNAGFSVAQGEYLLFLDSDDIIPTEKVARHLEQFDKQPEVGVVYSGWQYIDQTGNPLPGDMRPGKQGRLLKELLLSNFYCIPGAAILKRQLIDQVGLFDETLKAEEDIDMWTRIAHAGYKFGYIDELLLQYRIHANSLSTQADHQVKYAFARLDKFFSAPNLAVDVQQLKPEAYSRLHYISAARFFRAGQAEAGREHLRLATTVYPPLAADEQWLTEWASGFALSRHTPDAERFLNCLFDNLPTEATTLTTLRRKVTAQYHTGAIFQAWPHSPKNINRHIWPALTENPQIITNRGFLSIVFQSLFRQTGFK